jgi:hypothetical protein
MSRIPRWTILTAVVALLLTLGGPVTAANPKTAVGSARATEVQATLTYWTAARMEAARPLEVTPSNRPTLGISAQPDGRPHRVAGSDAKRGKAVQTGGVAVPALYTYPFPFTRYEVESQLTRLNPYRRIGKLFFTQNGGSFVCSAASAPGGPRQIVWTAGHCLSDGAGHFSTNVIFIPAYRDGVQPYGRFPATQLWTTSGWHFSGDLTYDLGAFSVGRNSAGQTLRSLVGYMGFAWNQSRTLHWDSFGFPQAAPFNGQRLQKCEASQGTDDVAIPGSGPDPIGIGCDMTGGSSGGPWVMNLRNGNYINGHNDYKYTTPSQPLAMYSPYFNNVAINIRCAAATGSGSATTC